VKCSVKPRIVKQIAQYQDGRLELEEVPQPTPPPGGVLVRTTHSVISIGTEKMKVEQARMNLLQKARARPDQVRKVLDTARNLGWKAALEKVRNRLETPTALGYSAGDVLSTGTVAGVAGFKSEEERRRLYLKPGDVIEAEIERIGVLRNPVVSWQEAHGEPAPARVRW